MSLIAGLDLGSSSAKLQVFDTRGGLVAEAEAGYPTHRPGPGFVEQDPRDWWAATTTVMRACTDALAGGSRRAGASAAGQIAAIGLTGQMQDLVTTGPGLEPAAILYSDTRAGAQVDRLRAELPGWEDEIGSAADADAVAAKIAWLAEHDPVRWERTSRVHFSAAGVIAWMAGGRAGCDVTTASTTGLLDAGARRWSPRVLSALGLEAGLLPELVGADPFAATAARHGLIGAVDADTAVLWGVRPGTPLVLGLGDAGAATDGLIGLEPGRGYLSVGTSAWVAASAPPPEHRHASLHALALPDPAARLLIGAVLSAGSAAEWSRTTLLGDRSAEEVEALVLPRLDAYDDRPLCLPGLGGERAPVRDAGLRGAFVDIGFGTTAADLHLGVLTGVAMGLSHTSELIGLDPGPVLLTGGATRSRAWRRVLADVLGRTVLSGQEAHPTCRSAARSAQAAQGEPAGILPFVEQGEALERTEPAPGSAALRERLQRHRALYAALGSLPV